MLTLTPISISATSQQYCASVTQDLCGPYCLSSTVQPVGNVTYSVAAVNVVNGTAYCTIQASGSVNYIPAGCCTCRPRTKMFTEYFDVAFAGTGTPTIAIVQTAGVNGPADIRCNGHALAYSMVGGVTITATFPA